jgi:hypothetical protein
MDCFVASLLAMTVRDDDYFRQRSSRSPDERSDIRIFGTVPHIALMRATPYSLN